MQDTAQGKPPNDQVHRARTTASSESDGLRCARSGATASWAARRELEYSHAAYVQQRILVGPSRHQCGSRS
jgi:hypothetical protein